jgi:hypothetical protein
MPLETSLYKYMKDNLDDTWKIYLGKIDRDEADPRKGDIVINFFKLPSFSAISTPSYLDNFQISVRSNYYDTAISAANDVINLFHLYQGDMEGHQTWVTDASNQGVIYEEEDVVHIPLNISVKYTLL